MNRINKRVLIFNIVAGFALLSAGFASAQIQIVNPLQANTLGELLNNIAGGISLLVLTLGGIMIVIAAILFVISSGNPQRAEAARKALQYAIIGIAVGIGASFIITLVSWLMSPPPPEPPDGPIMPGVFLNHQLGRC